MNNANVISVNPGIKTMGELNIDAINLSRISRTISNPGQGHSTFKNVLNVVFGINSDLNARWSAKLAAIRVVAGSILLTLGAVSLQGVQMGLASQVSGIVASILGVSLILGLFTRLLSIAGAGVTLVLALESLSSGMVDNMALLITLAGTVTGILGPGYYSLDRMIRRALFKVYRNFRRHDPDRDPSKISFDYSAFASVDTRIR